jgi:hypothetical protein
MVANRIGRANIQTERLVVLVSIATSIAELCRNCDLNGILGREEMSVSGLVAKIPTSARERYQDM